MTVRNCYRDITIREIDEHYIGEILRVAGWIENIRDHGGVSFIDLRDMYGVLQVVIRKAELLKGLTKETCVSISGPMEKRDEETYNPKIPTGTIELEAREITVLGRVYRQLPFEVMT
ncbi:MAG: Asp-tRNA(Asn)/Glu-tRNA(Gln) amidotransferase GatCAB subunit C, partial [Acetatifactor sp.]|nr:Asp-tRNA(Asn)/Glu-tRNA(Gln) amidotransferase GatCAB subunit C [Acetatifactor sp.]